MEAFSINVEQRIPGGKSAIAKLRREGMIPGVLYDSGDSTPVILREEEVREVVSNNGEEVPFNIRFDGKEIRVKIQELQRDPVAGDVIHVDLKPVSGNDYIH